MTRLYKSIASACVLAGVLAASGCAVVQEKTLGESLDETSAGTQIKSRLLANGGFAKFGETDVVVADRFALLVGRVPSEQDRVEAERLAREVNAVDEVANELVVADRSIARAINDPFIAAQIRARIVSDNDIKGVNYNIHVYDGVVYLLGFAQSEDELRRAAEQASVVGGVKRVVSYVKMRDREGRERFAPLTPASAAPGYAPAPAYQPAPAPAPLNVPQPSQPGSTLGAPGGAYRDPYAPGSTPPPGSVITAQPLPPTSPDAVARYPSASSSTIAPAPAPLNTQTPAYVAPAPAAPASPSRGGAPISIAPRAPGTSAPAPSTGQTSGNVDLLGVPPPPSGRQFE